MTNILYFKDSGLRRRKAVFYLFFSLEDTYITNSGNKGEVPLVLKKRVVHSLST